MFDLANTISDSKIIQEIMTNIGANGALMIFGFYCIKTLKSWLEKDREYFRMELKEQRETHSKDINKLILTFKESFMKEIKLSADSQKQQYQLLFDIAEEQKKIAESTKQIRELLK